MQFPDLGFCVLMGFFFFFCRVGEEVKYMWYRFLYFYISVLAIYLIFLTYVDSQVHNFCSVDFFNFCNIDCEINLSC